MRRWLFRDVAHNHLRAGVTRFQIIDDMARELMRIGFPAARAAQNKQNVLHVALLEEVISRSLKKGSLQIKLRTCTFHICTIHSKKIAYLIAESARSSTPWSAPESILANSACTFATSFAPAAWRSTPSGVTAALTARRSFGSSTRRTSPSASSLSTSWVMLERTQVIFVAHSLKLIGSPASTRCVNAPNFAKDSPTCAKACSRRCSTACPVSMSENISWGPCSPCPRFRNSVHLLFIYE